MFVVLLSLNIVHMTKASSKTAGNVIRLQITRLKLSPVPTEAAKISETSYRLLHLNYEVVSSI